MRRRQFARALAAIGCTLGLSLKSNAVTTTPLRYVALLAQVNTDPPTTIEHINDFGEPIEWERVLTGYFRTTNGLFPTGRTALLVGPADDQQGNCIIETEAAGNDGNIAIITSVQGNSNFNLSDNVLINTTVDITVYPEP